LAQSHARRPGLEGLCKPSRGLATGRSIRRATTSDLTAAGPNRHRRGFARCGTGPLLAGALGDVDVQYVWRFTCAHPRLDLAARQSMVARSKATTRKLDGQSRPMCWPSMSPPTEKAIVLLRGRKPSIPGSGASAGLLKLPQCGLDRPEPRLKSGQARQRCLRGARSRHRKVIATHFQTPRTPRRSFSDFMNSFTQRAFRNRQTSRHSSTHLKHPQKETSIGSRHPPQWKFHFTTTKRCPGSIRSRMVLDIAGASRLAPPHCARLKQLQEHIDA